MEAVHTILEVNQMASGLSFRLPAESAPDLKMPPSTSNLAAMNAYVEAESAAFERELPYVYRTVNHRCPNPLLDSDPRFAHRIAPRRVADPFDGIRTAEQVEALLAGDVTQGGLLTPMCRFVNIVYRLLARAWAFDDWLATNGMRCLGLPKRVFFAELAYQANQLRLDEDPSVRRCLDEWPGKNQYYQDLFDLMGILRRAGRYLRALEEATGETAPGSDAWLRLTDDQIEAMARSVLETYPLGTTMSYARKRPKGGVDPRMRLKPDLPGDLRLTILRTELQNLRTNGVRGRWYFFVTGDEWSEHALNPPHGRS